MGLDGETSAPGGKAAMVAATSSGRAMGAAAIGCLGTFDPQNLANFVWAYATVERASPRLFGALAQASLHRLDDFVAEGLSSTAWAYAKAGIPAPALFREIAKRAQAKLGSFNHQALCVIRVPLPRLVRDDAIDAYVAPTRGGCRVLFQRHRRDVVP